MREVDFGQQRVKLSAEGKRAGVHKNKLKKRKRGKRMGKKRKREQERKERDRIWGQEQRQVKEDM